MSITPQMIKELREKTGVGIGKCKEALEQAKGDMEEAISILRKAGIASAVKKEGRAANEGMIGFAETDNNVAIVEINAETDFVVKNDRFQQFLNDIAREIAETNPASLDKFLSQKFSKDASLTIDEYRASVVQAIGENIQIRRLKIFPKNSSCSVGVYSHLGGKIVTVVEIGGSDSAEDLAKDIAMHVAAATPEYVSPEDVPASVIENEREIARSQMTDKPANVVEKIVEGKISKYFDEVCLNRQHFIKNDKVKIGDLVGQHGKNLKISGFIRWSVGQE
jgi:elongation factor Ts